MFNKLIIYYHSGTGNALHASRRIAEEATARNISSELVSIDYGTKPVSEDIDDSTLVGFLYPTHGFMPSPAMLSFILHFPRKLSRYAFIMNCRAGAKFFKLTTPGASGLALWLAMLILLLKGYRLKGIRPLDMPSNWISVHPGFPAHWIEQITASCDRKLQKFASKMFDGGHDYIRAIVDIPIDVFLAPIGLLYYFIGRFFLAKTFVYTSDCNDCRLCADYCPSNAIRMRNGRPYWTYHCESCMRCMNLCPKKAIQSSHLMFAIGVALSNITFLLILTRIFPYLDFLKKGFIGWLINSYLGLLAIFAAYFIISKLLKLKVFNAIFRYTSLTSYWRRYRAKGITIKDYSKKN